MKVHYMIRKLPKLDLSDAKEQLSSKAKKLLKANDLYEKGYWKK